MGDPVVTSCTISPPQKPYLFEGHETASGGGYSKQIQPSRAVYEILKSNASMSMYAVDIGASGGNPECGPLFAGAYREKWKGALVDPRPISSLNGGLVKAIRQKAEPPTIAKFLLDADIPHDLDLLKVDIDCYDWEVTKALLEDGFRPKVFAAEITVPFPM